MSKIIRVGIVGMGKMGRIRFDAIKDIHGMRVVAVCDFEPSRLADYSDVARYAYAEQMLFDSHILDALIVCTYPSGAPKIVKAALKKGLHVFCEKPPARTVAELQEVLDVERLHPELKLMYSFNHRKHGAIIKAKSLIESNTYGDVLWMRGVYGKPGNNGWRNDHKISGGGILIDQGIHMLDLFGHFCGDFQYVEKLVIGGKNETDVFVILSNYIAQVATLHSSATHCWHNFDLEIGLENGYIIIDGILSPSGRYGPERIIYGRRSPLTRQITEFNFDLSFQKEIEEFGNIIRHDLPGNSHDAMGVMRLIERIYNDK